MEQGKITGLEVQKRNKQRVNVFIDGEYAFSLKLEAAAKLHKGQTLTEKEIAALRDEDSVVSAMDSAARFLSYRPRSEQEVRRNLEEKETAPAVIDAAIERMRGLGYLDDRAFTTFWIQERSRSKPLSPKALRYELRQKGIDSKLIDELLAEIDDNDAAYRAAQAHLRKLRGLDPKTFRHKLNGFLQRRGFAFSDARAAIERLIEELNEDDPNFFADSGGAAQDERWAEE